MHVANLKRSWNGQHHSQSTDILMLGLKFCPAAWHSLWCHIR
jgi:hypothetical protein